MPSQICKFLRPSAQKGMNYPLVQMSLLEDE